MTEWTSQELPALEQTVDIDIAARVTDLVTERSRATNLRLRRET